jgi:genome maintenance exonuclease 1
MDFKQSNKIKKREWIDDYFIQLAAYAAAHNETHGTQIRTGVVLMCVKPAAEHDEPVYQEFVLEPKEFDHWQNEWMKRVELYYQTA